MSEMGISRISSEYPGGTYRRMSYLKTTRREVLKHLDDLPHAPSVGMQSVPGESVGEHIGYTMEDDQEEMSDMDEQIGGSFLLKDLDNDT